jgi:hypothetical protein
MELAQLHDHGLDIGVSIGSLGLRVVMLGVVLAVAGFALLRPFLAGQLDVRPHWVTTAAGAGVLVVLLLGIGTTMPSQLLVLLIAAAAVPVFATYRQVPRVVQRAAPGVLALAGLGAAVWFARSLAGAGPAGLSDGLLLALIGLSWLVLCRFRSRSAGLVSAAGGWLLASAAVAGAGQLAMLALAEG